MARLHHLIPALIAATAHAGEITLEPKPYFIAHEFTATVLPEESTAIRIGAEAWTEFNITAITPHGSNVKKGEPLVVFDTDGIEKKLTDTRQAIATDTLKLTETELALATLEKTVPEQLARLKRNADKAAEELAYFTETSRKISEESAGFELRKREQILASYKEELKQLLQRYEADDITEDTEEIMLRNQRDAVEASEFALRKEILNHRRTLEVAIPRQAVQLIEARDDAALLLEKGTKDLPLSIDLKKLEVAGLKTSLQRNTETLADLEADRKRFRFAAPADGTFYHGSIEDGKWTTGDLIKTLVPKGSAPLGKTFATFIPSTTNLVAYAFLDPNTAQALGPEAKATASLAGRGDTAFPVALESLSPTPNPDLTYTAVFAVTWPEGSKPVAGQTLDIRLVSHSAEKAIAIPTNALEYGPKGWTAEVKLADGKTEKRTVTPGKSSMDETEITTGLEAGQVVIVP